MRLAALFSAVLLQVACTSTGQVSGNSNPHADAGKAANAVPAFISGMRQFTFEGRRAGEGYFSKDGKYLVFQSERESENPFYQIYLMELKTGATHRVSPGQGKTTCGWIHPNQKKLLFASTHHDPELKAKTAAELEERKNPKNRYSWSFDDAYDIFESDRNGGKLKNLTATKGYDAEASYSPDGRWIAFASNRAAFHPNGMSSEEAKNFARDPSYMMDIYIMRADGTDVKRLTAHEGYDGGPFFSPDGQRLTFRRFSPDGHTAEIYTMKTDGTDQRQLTRLQAMSWAPFYHPSGDYLIFASNKEGYQNFELYIVDVKGEKTPVRVSDIAGFDGLPVFSPDGATLLWTHSNPQGEAQLYRAAWNDVLARKALGLPIPAPVFEQFSPAITSAEARLWIEYLASEQFEGRMTGSEKEHEYSAALARVFSKLGLKPGAGRSFFQTYEFTSGVELQKNNELALKLNGETSRGQVTVDWLPLSFSKTGKFTAAPIVFAGYGIHAPADGNQAAYESYKGLDVKDQWVMVFSGLPQDVPNERRYHLNLYARVQQKARVARQNGALGLILIEDSVSPSPSMKLSFEGRADDAGLPVIRLSATLAEKIFAANGTSREVQTQRLAKGEASALPLQATTLQASIDLKPIQRQGRNVVASLNVPGARSTVVIGAHLDHLGRGEGGNSLSKKAGAIHFGADDNASGVAAVMEIAHQITGKVKRKELRLRQNVVFALWTGEEIGILGSSHFAKQAANERQNISAYINLDMVGRLREQLLVQGTGSAREWRRLTESLNSLSPMPLKITEDPYLPTDALAFYLQKVPVISFFTGSHSAYHTELDTPDTINYEGLVKVASWVASLTASLASGPAQVLTYQKVEGTPQPNTRGFRLYLGTIPDYSHDGQSGVAISGTSKGSPAEKAGLKPGDIIVELGGIKIKNLNDYVYCLQALKAGEKTEMTVVRAGRMHELEITPVQKTH